MFKVVYLIGQFDYPNKIFSTFLNEFGFSFSSKCFKGFKVFLKMIEYSGGASIYFELHNLHFESNLNNCQFSENS